MASAAQELRALVADTENAINRFKL